MITYPRALPSWGAQEKRWSAQNLQKSFSSVGSHFTGCVSHISSLTRGMGRNQVRVFPICVLFMWPTAACVSLAVPMYTSLRDMWIMISSFSLFAIFRGYRICVDPRIQILIDVWYVKSVLLINHFSRINASSKLLNVQSPRNLMSSNITETPVFIFAVFVYYC